jgi:hypothetical protein
MPQKQQLLIHNYGSIKTINLDPKETFQRSFRNLLGVHIYEQTGHFIWYKNKIDGSIECIPLREIDSPSSLQMDITRPQILWWKKAGVLTLFKG